MREKKDSRTGQILREINLLTYSEFWFLKKVYFRDILVKTRVSYSNYSYSNYSSILRYSNLEYFWPNTRTIRVPKKFAIFPRFDGKKAELTVRVSYSNYSYSNYSSILRYSNLEYYWPNTRTIRVPKKRHFDENFAAESDFFGWFWGLLR